MRDLSVGNNLVNLAWTKKPPSGRGPKPKLSVDQIARAAIRLADTEGMAAVTMQRLAREVDLTTMALYRYFAGKGDLLALMIDSVSDSEPRFGKPSWPWNERLKEWAHRCLSIYRDHPWFLEATSVRKGVMGPNELMWMEAALAMLAEAGLAPQDRDTAFIAVVAHVRGHATFQQVRRKNESTRELVALLKSEPNRYPVLLESVSSGAFSKSSAPAFDFGLDSIIEAIRSQARDHRSRSRRG